MAPLISRDRKNKQNVRQEREGGGKSLRRREPKPHFSASGGAAIDSPRCVIGRRLRKRRRRQSDKPSESLPHKCCCERRRRRPNMAEGRRKGAVGTTKWIKRGPFSSRLKGEHSTAITMSTSDWAQCCRRVASGPCLP